jgi:hypothetical protein
VEYEKDGTRPAKQKSKNWLYYLLTFVGFVFKNMEFFAVLAEWIPSALEWILSVIYTA